MHSCRDLDQWAGALVCCYVRLTLCLIFASLFATDFPHKTRFRFKPSRLESFRLPVPLTCPLPPCSCLVLSQRGVEVLVVELVLFFNKPNDDWRCGLTSFPVVC